MSVDLTELS